MKLHQVIGGNCASGQALLELALIMPVLLILFAGMMQLALICQTNLLAHMAVRHAVQIYWQGGSKRQIQSEVADYFRRYPFMADQNVQVSWRTTFLNETVEVACEPPMLFPMAWLGKPPVVRASMCLARELFSLRRIPTFSDIMRFGDKLRESR
ncbi:MAG: pilus assembly protein [Firmicutes bacterium]|nr:pilus assembly protein [Bacillota bacterium]